MVLLLSVLYKLLVEWTGKLTVSTTRLMTVMISVVIWLKLIGSKMRYDESTN